MTTQQFITNTFGVTSQKDRHCSSVFADHDGNIFSYGYHYPLLFEIDGVTFRNAVGYSNTTAKHINWARQADSVDVWLSGCNQYTYNNPENAGKVPSLLRLQRYGRDAKLTRALKKAIMFDLEAERADIQSRIDGKKRTDTQVYRALVAEMADCVNRIATVKTAWGIK